MKEALIPNPERPLPDNYHARTGHKLDGSKSKVYDQIGKIQEYANENEMKLNLDKCKFMVFNPTVNFDFVPNLEVEGIKLDTVEEMKLLGLVVTNNLKWRSNTNAMLKKAYIRMWMIKRLKNHGALISDLIDVFNKQIRSTLECGVPVWNPGLTQLEISDIERVQKVFLHIALGNEYSEYNHALEVTDLETLASRRTKLCNTFASKSAKHTKHGHWFAQRNEPVPNTRSLTNNYMTPLARLARYKNSPIPYLTRLLNGS